MKEYKLQKVFTVFYRYLTVNPPKIVIILMLLEGGRKNDLFDKKIILPNLFLHYLKSHKISDL